MMSFSLARETIFSGDSIGGCEDFENADASFVSGAIAMQASFRSPETSYVFGISIFAFGDMRENFFKESSMFPRRVRGIFAFGAEDADEALGNECVYGVGNGVGSHAISTRRAMLPAALLVWSVEENEVTVRPAFTAILAVSSSRISPTRIIGILTNNGSKPHGERVVSASRHLRLGDVWISYSIGSSIVTIFVSGVLSLRRMA